MTGARANKPSEADLEAALDWHAVVNAASADAKAWESFAAWLEAAPAHRLAFDMAEDLHATIDGNAGQIVGLLPQEAADIPSAGNENRRRWIRRTVAAAAAALAAAGLALAWLPDGPRMPGQAVAYAAPAGQARSISLADGSHVDLSPGSLVRVWFDASSRRLRLERGEALFQVGQDARRALVLLAGDLRIRDIGTQFDVALRAARVSVTVVSGIVSITPASESDPARMAVTLSAGQQFVQALGSPQGQVVQTDAAAVLSWRSGFLTYQDAPLSDVVADINRYFAAHVTLADATTGARRFSGVLKAETLESTLRRLSVLMALPVVHKGEILQLGATNDGR